MSTRVAAQLAAIANQLRASGREDLAGKVGEVLVSLEDAGSVSEAPELLTTGQAAELLGLRSINTVKKWAREGRLEGYRRGGRVLVTRRSVQRFTQHPEVARERAYERDMDEVFAAFDGGDAPLPAPPRSAGPARPRPLTHGHAAGR